jgi:hypothetical protein
MSVFDFFDDIWCIHHASRPVRWRAMQARFERLGLSDRVRCLDARASPGEERIGRALSHRRIIQDAVERGLRGVLAIEDETLFLDRTEDVLGAALTELRGRPWKLLHLGTWRGSDGLAEVPDCRHLRQPGGRVGPHAIGYGEACFDELLARMPVAFRAMEAFLGKDGSIDSILADITPSFVVHPAVATVPPSLPYQEPADQRKFVV